MSGRTPLQPDSDANLLPGRDPQFATPNRDRFQQRCDEGQLLQHFAADVEACVPIRDVTRGVRSQVVSSKWASLAPVLIVVVTEERSV